MTSITFLGATGTVTGSKYLVEADGAHILIDCGLFQGIKSHRERNRAAPPFDPATLDAVILTHAHIDHSGYLPKLCNMGFSGRVYCTSGTQDLLQVLLPDSGYLQEEEVAYANKHGYSKHRPAKPLYTAEDAKASLRSLYPIGFNHTFEPANGITARFSRAGHILGSACITLTIGGKNITFSGDVGRPDCSIMKAPDMLPKTDYLIIESTYGDRRHPTERVDDAVAKVAQETFAKGGTLLIPAFAVGRAQQLLQIFADLRKAKKISRIPVFLDSPMAIKATEIFRRHKEDHRLNDDEVELMYDLAHFTKTREESKAIDKRIDPMIIISASGMATGGRILHHLEKFLPDPKNTVLIVGFQGAGTRGRALLDGADEVKMFGKYVTVRALIKEIRGLSAHADYLEIIDWLKRSNIQPQRVFVTHGEPAAADAMRRRLTESFQWDVVIPQDGAKWEIK